MPNTFNRRDFVRLSAVGTIGALACRRGAVAAAPARARGLTVLFQGDSITDAGRARNNAAPNASAALGFGYPMLVAAAVMRERPDAAWRFFNRGVSGNRVPDLQARWDADAIALAPDVLSILVGVNDFWHKRLNGYTGTVADYGSQLDALIVTTRTALPKVRVVMLEPFVLRVGAVDDTWFPEFDERRAVAARVAQRAGVTFVPLHDELQRLAAASTPRYWAADGVHPTPAGHQFIAERWRAATGI